MSFQVLCSKITCGNFQFSGVHEVRIRKSIHSINDTATIILPSIAKYIPKNSTSTTTTNTSSLPDFQAGSPIQIDLGYNNDLNSEFTGFIKRTGTGMPFTIECEGYVRELRQNVNISGDFRKKPTSAAKLLALAVQGTDISVVCPVDFPITGVKLTKFNGVQICDLIKEVSLGALTIFFITPKTLWCGLVYLAFAGNNNPFSNEGEQVNYRIGFNCPMQRGLEEHDNSEPIQVIIKGKSAAGKLLHAESKENKALNKKVHLSSQIADSATMGKFAQEKEYMTNYVGYQGTITGFLVPYAYPGLNVNIINKFRPDLNGVYLSEAMEVSYGVKGARRTMHIGPKANWINSATN